MTEKIEEKLLEEMGDILRRFGNFIDGYDADLDELDIDESLAKILSIIKEHCVIPVEGELPEMELSPDALDAIDVKGVFPHVATAITLALAHQSKSIQQEMLKAGYRKVREIEIVK